MAIALTSTTLVDSKKIAVIQFSAMYPAEEVEEVDALKVDASTLEGAPTNLKIQRIWYTSSIGGTFLEFDGATQGLACVIPLNAGGFMDYRSVGGLVNTAVTPTGDISLTTLGTSAAGTGYSITIEVSKS